MTHKFAPEPEACSAIWFARLLLLTLMLRFAGYRAGNNSKIGKPVKDGAKFTRAVRLNAQQAA